VYQKGGGQQNLLGWLALVFGVLAVGCCCCPGLPFLGGIPAVVLGVLHLQKVKKGQASMDWLGWVGIALGAIGIILAIVNLATGLSSDFVDDFQNDY
jgi:hypothetical protein